MKMENLKDRGESMITEVKVETSKRVEDYLLIRGIQVNQYGRKEVVAEKEIKECNCTMQELSAQFLSEHPEVTFCSVEHNFRLV